MAQARGDTSGQMTGDNIGGQTFLPYSQEMLNLYLDGNSKSLKEITILDSSFELVQLRVDLTKLTCFACGCHFLGIFYLLAILMTRGVNVQILLHAWEGSRIVLRLPRPV